MTIYQANKNHENEREVTTRLNAFPTILGAIPANKPHYRTYLPVV